MPKGGPDGGDGGQGGSVVVEATRAETTLAPLSKRGFYEAPSGRPGGGNDRAGADAADLVLAVPEGTIVRDAASGIVLKDLDRGLERVVVARGGRGGRGNRRFATATNRAPRRADPGEPGEERRVELELKLLADVGLVGFPNAGKSSLLRALSRARPRVAAFPFTTLTPVLGVVETEEFERFTAAEIPGLVPGAHEGRGLGDRFLRHLGRTRFCLYLLDFAQPPTGDPRRDYEALRGEVAAHSAELASRPHGIAACKMDLPAARERLRRLAGAFPVRVFPVSSVSGLGIPALKKALARAATGGPGLQPRE